VELFAVGFSVVVCAFVPAQIMLAANKMATAEIFRDEYIAPLLCTRISRWVQEV